MPRNRLNLPNSLMLIYFRPRRRITARDQQSQASQCGPVAEKDISEGADDSLKPLEEATRKATPSRSMKQTFFFKCPCKYLIPCSNRFVFLNFARPFSTPSLRAQEPCQSRLGLSLDSAAYTDLLQSATKTRSLLHGKLIHSHLIKASFKPCLFLLNNLLNMYCKCSDMDNAGLLFERMPVTDVISWNSIVSGYAQLGSFVKTMDIFVEARNKGIRLDRFSYASVLSVCAQTGDLQTGMIVHGLVVVSGFGCWVFLTNSLIDMYSKCSQIDQARLVFDHSDDLDDVSWNSLISGYVWVGRAEEALRTFVQMHRLGVEMNSFSLGSVLKACSISNEFKYFGEIILGCIIKVRLDLDVVVGAAMLDMFAKNGGLKEAIKIFKNMPDRNVVVFNSMIAGFSRSEETETCSELTNEALDLFSEMQRKGIRPSRFTFSSVLQACNLIDDFVLGKQIHAQVLKNNLRADEFIGSGLIDMYSKSGAIEDGLKCFHSTPKVDIVSWTSMISGFNQSEHFEQALRLFNELLATGRRPDLFTISSAMSASANLALARSGEQIQSHALKAGFHRFTVCGNSQIFMYAKSGNVDAASQTFKETGNHDVVSWSAMISCHAQHGWVRDALTLFEEMKDSGVTPNHITFLGVLTACSHGGLVDEGFRYYDSMKRDYDMDPNVKHCACIVDLLGRAGRLGDAEKFIADSGFDADPVVWRALLGSCRIHRDMERGTRVADRIMELEPQAAAAYVLLYNMYLDSGEQSLANKTRDLMTEKNVKKEPGLSWIEIRGAVHSFVVGDKSHPQSLRIYSKLEEMLFRIKEMDSIDDENMSFKDQIHEPESLINCHSEKLAVALGMIALPESAPVRVMKNLRVCGDCHTTMKLLSQSERREIVLRDPLRFHHFRGGLCSCGDYW